MLDDFLKNVSATAGESKLKNIERVMLKCIDVLETPLNKITKDKLLDFLSLVNKSDLEKPTKNEIKKHLKRFILSCSIYRDNFEVIDILKKFKIDNDINYEKVNPDTILKENEVPLLMKATDSIKYKTLIILSWETAGRPQELLDTKWEQVNFDNKTIRLFSNKTAKTSKGGWRTLPINESVAHLERLRDEWGYDNRTNKDFIFLGNNRDKRLTTEQWENVIKELSLKALGRVVYPYLIRHGRLTAIQDNLPSKTYEDFAGHSLEMATRYRHPSQAHLLETMKKGLYSIKELTKEQKNELQKQIDDLKKVIKEILPVMQNEIQNLKQDKINNEKILKYAKEIERRQKQNGTNNKKSIV